mmetsp:Transcript_1974/g.5567  ORF Transcript_1974/g.5567 Transcript_1974/m.5567 type:complete len:218 (+) Transcript_1974:182-835(+)
MRADLGNDRLPQPLDAHRSSIGLELLRDDRLPFDRLSRGVNRGLRYPFGALASRLLRALRPRTTIGRRLLILFALLAGVVAGFRLGCLGCLGLRFLLLRLLFWLLLRFRLCRCGFGLQSFFGRLGRCSCLGSLICLRFCCRCSLGYVLSGQCGRCSRRVTNEIPEFICDAFAIGFEVERVLDKVDKLCLLSRHVVIGEQPLCIWPQRCGRLCDLGLH